MSKKGRMHGEIEVTGSVADGATPSAPKVSLCLQVVWGFDRRALYTDSIIYQAHRQGRLHGHIQVAAFYVSTGTDTSAPKVPSHEHVRVPYQHAEPASSRLHDYLRNTQCVHHINP
eukprot:GHRR01011000.1.p1 GENE.GHRR01011000.1~~GHRR01011000.1.p1  ORF type:complete len:116 (-),score=23.73 GHRR01011000.1:27-374(-)